MSDELTIIPAAEPTVPSFHAVALNAADMQLGQGHVRSFLTYKCTEVGNELTEMQKALDVAITRKWAATALKNQVRSITRRKVYYDKLLAAVEAGYTIVPNMPCDIFAIRTNRKHPDLTYACGESQNGFRSASPTVSDEKAKELPVGIGEYQNPEPAFHEMHEKDKTAEGKDLYKVEQFGDGWQDIVFPLAAAHSEVMEATADSMKKLIFDHIGIVPQTHKRLRGDPLVIGQIVRKVGGDEKVASFLIAWHLDVRTL